jgi:arginine repressor
VTSGKADNAVQVAQELNMNRNDRISAQTVRRALKNMGMKAVVKKKKNRFYQLNISHNDLISLGNINTGPLKIGNVSYGLMRPKSIV